MITLYEILFEEIKAEDLSSGGKYIGIQLDSNVNELLELPQVKEKLDQGWTFLAKHVSIVPPPFIGGLIQLINNEPLRPKDLKTKWAEFRPEQAKDFANKLKELSNGQSIQMEVTEIGVSPDAIAVKVKIDEFEAYPPLNAFRHLTLAIPPGGKAMNSNNIKEWSPVNQQGIILSGVISIL